MLQGADALIPYSEPVGFGLQKPQALNPDSWGQRELSKLWDPWALRA